MELIVPKTYFAKRVYVKDNFLYIPSRIYSGIYSGIHSGIEQQPISINDLCDSTRGDNNRAPTKIVIEYCSGNGQWIIEQALAFPATNFIAVEKKMRRAKRIWEKCQKRNLKNLFIVAGDALIFSKYFIKPHSISECYIHFPDPWPKRKHHKNRFINREFMSYINNLLKPHGLLKIVTDHKGYSEHILAEATQAPLVLTNHHEIDKCSAVSYFSTLFEQQNRQFYSILLRREEC